MLLMVVRTFFLRMNFVTIDVGVRDSSLIIQLSHKNDTLKFKLVLIYIEAWFSNCDLIEDPLCKSAHLDI